MTNLIYHSKIYQGYINSYSIIKNLELEIIHNILGHCKPTDIFINSTWGEIDQNLIDLFKSKPKRAIVYSGMDWHDSSIRKKFHDFIKLNTENVIYIGNSDGKGYFSYWLFFIKKYFKEYPISELQLKDPEYLYMCLNRKRHRHRVMLVDRLNQESLLDKGAVSLSGDPEKNIPPINLPFDITETIGNLATNYKEGDIPNDICSIGDQTIWNKHLINVVTETTVITSTFISEKTWKPIIGLRPFLIVGDSKIYTYLKEYGIDTFDDLFGTGYNDSNYENRIEWVIKNLKKFSTVNTLNLYREIYPRLVSNKNQLEKIFKVNDTRFKKVLKIIENE